MVHIVRWAELIAVCIVDVWKFTSVITAVEESDGRDFSMVWRPIVIVSNWKTQSGPLLSVDLWNGKEHEKKVAPPGVELRMMRMQYFFHALCRFKGLQTVTAQIVSFIRRYHYWSSDHRGVLSIRLLHCCDIHLWSFTHQHCEISVISWFMLTLSEWLLLILQDS